MTYASGSPSTAAACFILAAALASCRSVESAPSATGPAPPSGVVLHGIALGSRVTGDVTMTSDVNLRDAGPFCVTYLLSGKVIAGPTCAPPYEQVLSTTSLWDGTETARAVARQIDGRLVGQSDAVEFAIANGDTTLTSNVSDAPPPLRGIFTWRVEADRPFPAAEIDEDRATHRDVKKFEALILAVDGAILKLNFGPTASVSLDTTRFMNGPHELFVAAYSYKKGTPPVAMSIRTVQFDNGHALVDVLPRWRDVFLAPGERVPLDPIARYADGAPGAAPPKVSFTSDRPDVATVDDRGVITAVREGVATITLKSMGEPTTARVFVDPPHGVPHFGAGGRILTAYDPNQSEIVRTVYSLDGEQVSKLPGLADQLKVAGVNTLTTGFYRNPADMHATDLASWRPRWEPWFDHIVSQAKSLGMRLLLSGDDIARNPNELANSIQNPWSADAIRLAFTKARDSGLVTGVEMVDEASVVWGATPHPKNGAWLGRKPPLPDDAFLRLMSIIDSVAHRPPVTWPVLGIAGRDAAHDWMGDPTMSDYASEYWDVAEWRHVYPWGPSLSQQFGALDTAVVGRYPVLRHDRPQLLLVRLGPYVHPVDVAAEIMYGAAMGMAGFRAYGYDSSIWKNERATKTGAHQTGSDPFDVGTERWWAMASAFTLVARLQPWLLQRRTNALDLGPDVISAGRTGAAGNLFMAVNGSDAPRTATVDLSPYAIGSIVTEIHVVGATIAMDAKAIGPLGGATRKKVTFAPGEAIIWVFASDGSQAPAPVRIVSPLPDATLVGSIPITLDLGDRPSVTGVRLEVDGHPVETLSPGATSALIDATALRPGVWHCLIAQVVASNGTTAGEARTAFRVAPRAPSSP